MNKTEFIRTCRRRGYCSVRVADEYVKKHPKDDYTEDDLQKCYHIDEDQYLYRNYDALHDNNELKRRY